MPDKKQKPAAKAGAKRSAARRPPTASPKPAVKAKAKPKVKRPLTAADILSESDAVAKKLRKPKKVTAKTLGVYDSDRDILDQYLQEVSKTPLLTQPQEIAIAKLVRAGDEEAMKELVTRNLRFVISYVKKYQGHGACVNYRETFGGQFQHPCENGCVGR